MSAATISPLLSLSPELSAALQERIERSLRGIAIAGKDVNEDPTVIIDFRRTVPVTDYGSYKPFVAKFFSRPCKQSELENLLAPGLPSFIAISSSTTGNKPKLFAKYPRGWSNTPPSFATLSHPT
ncbi:hypothetical protein EDC04DRAFT_2904811 [Pisolithus marmoratus]|nr:hypothetical protein EDC04DRAFT_2904811 [Pisolithus marmoratus]